MAETLRQNLQRGLSIGASALAFAAASPAEVVADTTPNDQSQQIALCKQDALASYHFGPKANIFHYVKRNGTINRWVSWLIRADPMPAECNGLVKRKIGEQEYIGTNRNHLVPNTFFRPTDFGSGAVYKHVLQRGVHSFQHGDCISGTVVIEGIAGDGSKPAIGTHPTSVVCS